MKVTYIKHSGFLVETENSLLLFDYFEGSFPELPQDKPFYYLSSHSHYDHFSSSVFDLSAGHPENYYILSDDISKRNVPSYAKDHTIFTGPDQTVAIGDITVTTLRSTDLGVAFIVNDHGKVIYHAGDLNYWIWEEEGEDYNRQMASDYLREMEKIRGLHFDLAFLTLDPRQSDAVREKGIEFFCSCADADVIFPMHLWEKYDIAVNYAEKLDDDMKSRFYPTLKQNQEFII